MELWPFYDIIAVTDFRRSIVKKRRFNILDKIKIGVLSIFILGAISAGALGGAIVEIMGESPPVDLSKIGESASENSVILTADGDVLEQIETSQYRELIPFQEIPSHVVDAFVAVEDERYYSHTGIDIIGIGKSVIDNLWAGDIVRGGSTITQQLARDLYLNDERTFDRKIKEAYIALKMDSSLEKNEILQIYLNRVFLGQNAYGIQAASRTYFSKDVKDLTIAEAAALASIPKAPTNLALYNTIRPEEVSPDDKIVGEIVISNDKYIAVYNPSYEDRQAYVLSKMLELGKISQAEYDQAVAENIYAELDPPIRSTEESSNYFSSLVKGQVIESLIERYNLTEDEAMDKLYNGGLKIYTTIDMDLQEEIEDIYKAFTSFATGSNSIGDYNFLNLSFNDRGDILGPDEKVIYYSKENLYDDDDELYLEPEEYDFTNGSLVIEKEGLMATETGLYIGPFFTVDGERNLRTHNSTTISMDPALLSSQGNKVVIAKEFIDQHPELYEIISDNLYINPSFYNFDKEGVLQPQSSTVIIDHTNGHIKAIVGGRRDKAGGHNRAYAAPRQPGSSIKPLAVYTPALDTSMTLASPIDDIPHFDGEHRLWPTNWYGEYRGITTLRKSLEISGNVAAVKTLEKVGIPKSKEYLEKFGLINKQDPSMDHFVSALENPNHNDENTSAMGLGGMAYGFTNLEMTGAYSALANDGAYIKPLSFTKVTDNQGNIILENESKASEVVSKEIAFLIRDALISTTSDGVASNARFSSSYDIGGKTGTSGTIEENIDSWFVGFSPYYTIGVWMGADDARIKLTEVSAYTTQLWGAIGRAAHANLKAKNFEEPATIEKMSVCNQSGLLPTDACRADYRGVIIEEYFTRKEIPKRDCDVHVFRKVDPNNNLLVKDGLWGVDKSFITRSIPYDPKKHDGILPTDWDMMAPTEYSSGSGYTTTEARTEWTGEKTEETKSESTTEETESESTTEETEDYTETEAPPATEPPVQETEAPPSTPEDESGGGVELPEENDD